jgi:hypothetical protein
MNAVSFYFSCYSRTHLFLYNTLILKHTFLLSALPSSSPSESETAEDLALPRKKISSKSNDTTLNTFLTHRNLSIFPFGASRAFAVIRHTGLSPPSHTPLAASSIRVEIRQTQGSTEMQKFHRLKWSTSVMRLRSR